MNRFRIALLANVLIDASNFTSVLPVRFGHGLHSLETDRPYHYGPFVTRASGELNILPQCLWLLSSDLERLRAALLIGPCTQV